MSLRWFGRSRREEQGRRGRTSASGRARRPKRQVVLEALEDRKLLSAAVLGTTAVGQISARQVVPLTGGLVGGGSVSVSNTPVFAGTAQPTLRVQLTATPLDGSSSSIILGQTTADAQGRWTLTSVPLAAGRYKVSAVTFDPVGTPLQTAVLLQSLTVGAISGDTTAPVVTSTTFSPRSGQVAITFRDNVGMDPATLLEPGNFQLTLVRRGVHRTFFPIAIALQPGPAGSGQTTATYTFNLGRRVVPGTYVLTIDASGVTDLAGNTLAVNTFLTFPQTTQRPNPNYVAAFQVNRQGQVTGPSVFIPDFEVQAAARYVRFVRSHTVVRVPHR